MRQQARERKRFEVVELLPAMLLSALVIAGSHTTNAGDSRPSVPADAPTVEITVTNVH